MLTMKCIIIVFIYLSTVKAALRDTKRIYVGTGISFVAFHNDSQYKSIATQEFNSYTSVRQFHWSVIESVRGSPNYTFADQLIRFANGSRIRAQPLVWYQSIPNWVYGLKNNPYVLEQVLTKHIRELVSYTKGKVSSWDVVNEVLIDDGTLRSSVWSRNLGSSFIAKAFRTANSVDPNVKLYINEYGVYGKNWKKTEAYYHLVKKLLSSGVPIHGVGFQCHLTAGQFPNTLSTTMRRFADLGLDVAITELDVRILSPVTASAVEQQARDYARAFAICRSISKCVGVTVWQFTDRFAWLANLATGYGYANLFDSKYNPKPAYNSSVIALKS